MFFDVFLLFQLKFMSLFFQFPLLYGEHPLGGRVSVSEKLQCEYRMFKKIISGYFLY